MPRSELPLPQPLGKLRRSIDRARENISDSWNPECQSGYLLPATFSAFSIFVNY
jgi:hypothetical protein